MTPGLSRESWFDECGPLKWPSLPSDGFETETGTGTGTGDGNGNDRPSSKRAGARFTPDPRVIRQLNIDLPEPEYFDLKELVESLPRMSMRKLARHAIAKEVRRIRLELGKG